MILLLLLFPFAAFSQQITFEIIYGGEGYDEARSIYQTTDGGYIVAGTSGSYPSGNSDVFLLKIDSVGAIQWFKFPGGSDLQAGYSVQQTSDGGFIVAGLTNAGDFGGYDVYLMKTDINGDSLWSKTYGGTDWDFGYSVEETTDNGFIIGGTTYSFGKGEQMYLVKTDANGDTLWTRNYGGVGLERANCVTQTTDGGYVLTGYTSSYGAGQKDVYILKTDASGDSLWVKTYGNTEDDEGTYIEETMDGGFILSAIRTDPATERHFMNYIKTNVDGSQQWQQVFSAAVGDDVYVIHQRPDGGYSAAGSAGVGAGMKDYFFVNLDGSGNPQGSVRTYGGSKNDIAHSMIRCPGNGFILAGETESYGDGSKEIYLLKIDSLGNSTGNVLIDVEEIANMSDDMISIYPNPAAETMNVFADISNTELTDDVVILLTDISGKVLLKEEINHQIFNKHVELNVNDISSGLYILKFSSGELHFQRKVLVQR
jgi:hypothetical protein